MANKPAGAAKSKGGADPATPGRIKQIRMVAGIIRKANPRALPLVALAGVGVLAVFVIVGLFTGLLAILIPLGLASGLMAAMILFGRFAQSAQYAAVEGQPGAAAAILQSMRGGWTVTPAVSANRSLDVVHRAVGRPGVVLVGEGSPNRLGSLLAAEKKRIARVAYDVPIYDFQVGDEEGQIPIRKLQRKLMRLPRNLKGPAVADLNFRLKALPQSLQAPKGPLPKTGRMPKPPRPIHDHGHLLGRVTRKSRDHDRRGSGLPGRRPRARDRRGDVHRGPQLRRPGRDQGRPAQAVQRRGGQPRHGGSVSGGPRQSAGEHRY
jgi:hypothetical protein